MSYFPNGRDTAKYYKASARVATTADITLSAPQTIDGVSAIAGDRVLVKDQATGSENGLYVVAAGAWSRAVDADQNDEVRAGLLVFVSEGTAGGNKLWMLTTNDPIVVGTTALVFSSVAGSGDVSGPGSSTDNAIVRFDGTTGKLIQNSGVTISDTNDLVVAGDATVNGSVTLGNASGDTVTHNAGTVSIPNDLNFDSNTLFLDAANNRIAVRSATAHSALQVAGSLAAVLTALSANTTLSDVHYAVTVDASGGAKTITLPTAVGITGRMYVIKKIDSSSNAVTVDANGSQTIDGALTVDLASQYEAMTIISDGANWLIL